MSEQPKDDKHWEQYRKPKGTKMKKTIPVELTLSISAMIIAIASITISIWESSTMRKHYHLSVMPRLNNSFSVDDSSSSNASAYFEIRNNGLGPAVIISREYFLDGKKIDDSKNHFSVIILQALNFDNTAGSTFQSISKGFTISSGDNMRVFGLYFSNRESFYRQRMKLHDRLSFIIKYESLYGEQYEESHNMDKINN